MKKKPNLAELIAILFKAFEKDSDEELAELYFQRLSQYDIDKVQARILELIDSARFFPRIGEILDYTTREERADEIKFLARFRKQATSSYAFDHIDDDIYTVKKYLGPRIVEDAHAKDWHWIEKRAVQVYHSIRDQHIELIENPNKHRVKVLPSGSRYIEPTDTISLKKSIEHIGHVLP